MKENDLDILVLIIFMVIISIVFTVIYLCYFIDCKNINLIALIIRAIFFFCFLLLNFILSIDFYIASNFDNYQGLIRSAISAFYSHFNRINSIMASIILPFIINCFESGYKSKIYIVLE